MVTAGVVTAKGPAAEDRVWAVVARAAKAYVVQGAKQEKAVVSRVTAVAARVSAVAVKVAEVRVAEPRAWGAMAMEAMVTAVRAEKAMAVGTRAKAVEARALGARVAMRADRA